MSNDKTQISLARFSDTLVVKRHSMLQIVRGVGAGVVVELGEHPLEAGRSDDADLILDDPSASRRHFVIRAAQGVYVLEDQDSTNGTKVNHVPVMEYRLTNGDIITVGETDVAFYEETEVRIPGAE